MSAPQLGDLILVSRGTTILDATVRFLTTSDYFHAALIVDSERLIEARFSGVQYGAADKYAGRSSVLSPLGATTAQREAAVAFAQSKLGQPYGWSAIRADAERIGLHLNVGYRWRLHHLDCSALCAAAYASAGLWLTYCPAPTPGDLGYSPMLQGARPWQLD